MVGGIQFDKNNVKKLKVINKEKTFNFLNKTLPYYYEIYVSLCYFNLSPPNTIIVRKLVLLFLIVFTTLTYRGHYFILILIRLQIGYNV